MTAAADDRDTRLERLGAAIAAAKARLEAQRELADADIGHLLEALNDEVEQAREEHEADAHARLDKVEARLGEVSSRLPEA